MDPKTGKIYENVEYEDWAETQRRLKLHPAARRAGETDEDVRKIRNARKRLRRLGRGK